jgi:uncharacterized membrane-anchored protein
MQTLRYSRFAPLNYWRTIVLVMVVGFVIAAAFADQLAVLLGTLAAAFAFSAYERRRWISVSAQQRLGDAVLRLSLAMAVSYVLINAISVGAA